MTLTQKDLRWTLGWASDCLTPTEALVICSIYLDEEPLCVAADVLGCGEPNVTRIHQRVLEKMRSTLWPRTFDDLYPETLDVRDDATTGGVCARRWE